MIATLLQIVGLILLGAGLFVWFGVGPGLVGTGAFATVVGIAVERERR